MDAKPSPTELIVLKRLWRDSPMSAREIHAAVAPELTWSYSSTRKTLERMEEKGLVTAADVHGLKVYTPAVGKVATLGRLMKDFAAHVLDLDAPLPATTFAHSPLLDEADIEELERLLHDNGETKP